MNMQRPLTSAERVARRRAALRAQGLRPRTFWLPDTSTPEFREQARQTCAWLWDRVSADSELMAFAEAMTDEVLAGIDPAEDERTRRNDAG